MADALSAPRSPLPVVRVDFNDLSCRRNRSTMCVIIIFNATCVYARGPLPSPLLSPGPENLAQVSYDRAPRRLGRVKQYASGWHSSRTPAKTRVLGHLNRNSEYFAVLRYCTRVLADNLIADYKLIESVLLNNIRTYTTRNAYSWNCFQFWQNGGASDENNRFHL